jgi:hypothetical protein
VPVDAAVPINRLESIQVELKEDACVTEIFFNQNESTVKSFILPDPQRIVLDFEDSVLPEIQFNYPVANRFINRISASQNSKDKVRLVIETCTTLEYQVLTRPGYFQVTVFYKGKELERMNYRPEVLVAEIDRKEALPLPVSPSVIAVGKPEYSKNQKISSGDSGSYRAYLAGADEIPPLDQPPFEMEEEDTTGNEDTMVIEGQIRNKTASRTSGSHKITQVQNRFKLEASGPISHDISYKVSGLTEYDAIFDLTNHYNEAVEDDQEKNYELRDAYVDIGFDNFDIRLGKQQIVWGQAVGVFFADIVNPKNLREYILPDLEEIRIPVWAADVEWYTGENTFEFVFIPFPKFNEIGVQGAEFDFRERYSMDGLEQRTSSEEPGFGVDNVEFGLRWSTLQNGLDASVFFYHGYDKFAVNYRTITYSPDLVFVVSPEYEKMNTFGATFSYEILGGVAKGELIYNSGKYFSVSDLNDTDGVIKKDKVEYLLGFDHTFYDTIDTNIQFMHSMVLNHQETILEEDHRLYLSFWAQTSLLDARLELEMFVMGNLKYSDFMFRPKLTWKAADCLRLILGADIFAGEEKGDFGYFKDNDRIYLITTWYF